MTKRSRSPKYNTNYLCDQSSLEKMIATSIRLPFDFMATGINVMDKTFGSINAVAENIFYANNCYSCGNSRERCNCHHHHHHDHDHCHHEHDHHGHCHHEHHHDPCHHKHDHHHEHCHHEHDHHHEHCHHHHHHNHCKGTDYNLTTRIGEKRILNILFENNTNKPAQIRMDTSFLVDAFGNVIENTGIISYSPKELTIPACQCRGIKVGFAIKEPLEENKLYYANIKTEGNCRDKPIEVCINVLAKNKYDMHALCDSCRPKKGKHFKSHRRHYSSCHSWEDCCNLFYAC